MCHVYDVYEPTRIYQFLLPTAEPVTVGWGKKETQFHGSLGKQSAIKKEEVSGEKIQKV